MPWKLVSFLFILIIVTLFIGFNLDNRCDVSFIVYTFHDVPIFVSLLFAYVAGAVTVGNALEVNVAVRLQPSEFV